MQHAAPDADKATLRQSIAPPAQPQTALPWPLPPRDHPKQSTGFHAKYYTVTAAGNRGHINENCLKEALKADGVIVVEEKTLDGNLSGMFRFFIDLGKKTWQGELETRLRCYGFHVQSSNVADVGANAGGQIYTALATPGNIKACGSFTENGEIISKILCELYKTQLETKEEKLDAQITENTRLANKAREANSKLANLEAEARKANSRIANLDATLKYTQAEYKSLNSTNASIDASLTKKNNELRALKAELEQLKTGVAAAAGDTDPSGGSGAKRARSSEDGGLTPETTQSLKQEIEALRKEVLREKAITDDARNDVLREKGITNNALKASKQKDVELKQALVLAAKSSASASEERAKADIYKKQRDKASARQRTASRVVRQFMDGTKSPKYDKGLLQRARAFTASNLHVINSFDWPEATVDQQQITDMLRILTPDTTTQQEAETAPQTTPQTTPQTAPDEQGLEEEEQDEEAEEPGGEAEEPDEEAEESDTQDPHA